ncbi:hypothetical protein GHK86_06790 [Acidimicrobiaceae bacterium USS-CC1]|uniref:DUF3105 domain-containing protein n=1 Tax=Acidiferrimicrobium australe TaxID=2664430 RepID=A0ABW9QST6_9ACTN|nr:hypothetical protein [Acidiferrimicrobium australe]
MSSTLRRRVGALGALGALALGVAGCGAHYGFDGPLRSTGGKGNLDEMVQEDIAYHTTIDFTDQVQNYGHGPVQLLAVKPIDIPGLRPPKLAHLAVLHSPDIFDGFRGWPPRSLNERLSRHVMAVPRYGQLEKLDGFTVPPGVPGHPVSIRRAVAEVVVGIQLPPGLQAAGLAGLVVTYRAGNSTYHSAAWTAMVLEHHQKGPSADQVFARMKRIGG